MEITVKNITATLEILDFKYLRVLGSVLKLPEGVTPVMAKLEVMDVDTVANVVYAAFVSQNDGDKVSLDDCGTYVLKNFVKVVAELNKQVSEMMLAPDEAAAVGKQEPQALTAAEAADLIGEPGLL